MPARCLIVTDDIARDLALLLGQTKGHAVSAEQLTYQRRMCVE
jgi:hypothetical protein